MKNKENGIEKIMTLINSIKMDMYSELHKVSVYICVIFVNLTIKGLKIILFYFY